MQEAQRVAVNVSATNSLPYVPNFFESLDAQTFRDFTVTVVDNASTDDTARWLQEHRPDVAVLRNFRDHGWARAQNQALAMTLSRWPEDAWGERYVLVADPEIEFDPGALERLVSALDRDPSLSAVCPKISAARVSAVSDDGRRETERTNRIESTGILVTKFRGRKDRGAGEEDKGRYDAPAEVFGVPGVCGMFRASALAASRVGDEAYDEDFADDLADADLAWRMRRLGFHARCVPDARVWIHRHNGRTAEQTFRHARNRVWLAWKNDELLNRIAHAPWMLATIAMSFLSALVSFPRFRGLAAACAGLPKMFAKRRALSRRIRVSGAAMRRWFS